MSEETTTLQDLVKLALRVTTDAFDEEIGLYLNDCLAEMEALGVNTTDETDYQIQSAVIAYCKWKFGDADNKDEWERIYHTKLAQFQMMYTAGYANG